MPATNLQTPPDRRPFPSGFAYGIGATEVIFLIGFGTLAAGISLLWSFRWALLVCGLVLLFTAFWNAHEGK